MISDHYLFPVIHMSQWLDDGLVILLVILASVAAATSESHQIQRITTNHTESHPYTAPSQDNHHTLYPDDYGHDKYEASQWDLPEEEPSHGHSFTSLRSRCYTSWGWTTDSVYYCKKRIESFVHYHSGLCRFLGENQTRKLAIVVLRQNWNRWFGSSKIEWSV